MGVLFGLLNRIRGGLFGDKLRWGTAGARAFFSISTAVFLAAFFEDWNLLWLAPAFFLGCVWAWFSSIDLGRIEGQWLTDALKMTGRGILWTVFTLPVLYYFNYNWLVAFSGIVCPICYELGWRSPVKAKHFTQGPELAECIFWTVVGTIYLIFLATEPPLHLDLSRLF